MDNNRRQMHQAVCDNCGNKCEVPFQPTQGKPIYCTDCFRKKNDERGDRGDTRGGGGRDRFGGRDRRGGRDRFGGRERQGGGGGNDQVSEQIKAINNKLDRVINLLLAESPGKESPAKEPSIKSASKKPAAKKSVAKDPKAAKKPATKKASKKK